MVYFNPDGHNWGTPNYDIYGISTVGVAVVYSLFFYLACIYIWSKRNHPALHMRKISLAILSILILHVYLFMIMMAYLLNGLYPCNVEFWCMSIYLPLGIGLFQAQNQNLLLLSKGQKELLEHQEHMLFRPLLPEIDVVGRRRYWIARFKAWWDSTSKQGKFEGFVLLGICVQFAVSATLYCISRKFNRYGIISHHVSAEECRRGWEWIPSIFWQFLWNFCFGPYLVWKVRGIHDIYHWRLQTVIAIVAGLPGTPLWLTAIYSETFTSINRYWMPVMWFVPGLVTMELTTLGFAYWQLRQFIQDYRARDKALTDFDQKYLNGIEASGESIPESIITRSVETKRSHRMYSTDSLEECLNTNYEGLQCYASHQELNGENIIFLVKVIGFKKQCQSAIAHCADVKRVEMTLFRAALSIFVSLIHNRTAKYPINIESTLYNTLYAVFREAAEIVASKRTESVISEGSCVAPWEEPSSDTGSAKGDPRPESIRMVTLLPVSATRESTSHDSSDHIVPNENAASDAMATLADFRIPELFNEKIFDEAYKKVRYMVWCGTWQRYMESKRSSATV